MAMKKRELCIHHLTLAHEGPRDEDDLVAMSTPSAQSWSLNVVL